MMKQTTPIPSSVDQESGPAQEPPGDDEYYRGRELQERRAAKRSLSLSARRIHQQLAQLYAERRSGKARNDNDGKS